MSVSPGLHQNNMWRKWRGSLSLLTWIILQAISGLRHKTACYNFPLIVDPPCASTEMLLPTMFTLGVSSDVTCHSEISGESLRYKGVDEIRRCCQQRENDTVRDYCLPAMKNQLPGHYFPDFVSTCTASTKCQLSTSESRLLNTDGADYVTFTFECVHKDTVLHIQRNSTQTGQEVYLYNDQHDGLARAYCLAYSHECNSHVIIQLAATRVVSAACIVDFTDGDVSTKVDCKNTSASRNCSSAMFESKLNYVNMSIFMTVDPGGKEKEFLWLRAKADTGENVTVVCGANIPADVSLNCPTSASTTTTSTTSTTTTAAATATATATTQTVTSNNASSNHAQVAVTSSPGKPQAQLITTSAGTTMHSNASTTLSLSSVNGFSSNITPRHPDPNSPTTLPQQSGVTETTSEATPPMDNDTSTPAATETLPSTPSKEVVIIGCSVGGVIMIAIIVTITVCVRRKKSSENTNPKRLLMEENHEDRNEPNGTRNSVSDGNVPNPIYEGTDDYKLGQLDRKTSDDVKDGYEPELESPYAYGFTRSRPAPSGLSLGKNFWVTQGHLEYYNDTVVNTEASGGHSEEKRDDRVSDLYAKVNKARGTDQVTDVYTQVDKPRKPARGTSGQYSAGENPGQDEDIDAMYAKVQKK
ncbi:uncharacterized protein LOC124120898 isoform X1 [Haliotis rufescens]|uniref:uncharacterized protein LOC124120898 isoform X1 n=1 Tax=Haliotis rufescens TaxID=6454 RepID=UPI00201EAF1E|nr:uncharacterized protein LOC124120898 isoform X1 [Haliotis rufescens]